MASIFKRYKTPHDKHKHQHAEAQVDVIQDDQVHNPYTEIQLLADHSDIVRFLLPIDDTRFLSAGDDNIAIIWDVKLGRKIHTLSGHTRPITCAYLLPEVFQTSDYYEDQEQCLLTGSSDKTICTWNVNTGECIRTLSQHNSAIKVLECLDTLELFCSGGIELCLWTFDGQLLHALKLSEEADVNHLLAITKDRIVVASGSNLEVCDVTLAPDMHGGTTYQLERVKKLVPVHRENVTCMIHVGANSFGTASLDGAINIWSTHTLTVTRQLNNVKDYYFKGYPYSVQHMVCIEEKYVIAAIGSGFCMYDIATGDTIIEKHKAHYSRILHLCLVYDNMFLATSSEDGTIRLWGAKPHKDSPTQQQTPTTQCTLEKLLGTSDLHPAAGDSKHPAFKRPALQLLGECVAHSGAVRMVLDYRDEGMVSCGVADGLVILWKDGLLQSSRRNEWIRGALQFSDALYLATGESFRSIAFQFRVGATTVGTIVSECCQILWERLAPVHMQMPQNSEDWEIIAANFDKKWNFPHCLGALDGKHVVMKAPWNSGSLYYNYKGTYSIVLLALVDANYKFIAIDIGAYGRNSDGGIFANSNLGKSIDRNTLAFPEDAYLPGAAHLGPLPYVVIGDAAFPLQRHLMRPFPGRGGTQEHQIFNYRLSRARRIVENAFGILAVRWRLYHTKIAVRPEWVTHIVKATCVLHNFLQSQSTPAQVQTLIKEAQQMDIEGLQDINATGNRAGKDAIAIRNSFVQYFAHSAPVSWQNRHVSRGLFTD